MALKPVYRRLLYVALGVVAFLVLLPELIRVGARYALTEFSAQSATIEDIDLNLFTGRFGVTGLRIDYDDKTTLSLGSLQVDIDLAALFSKHVLLEEINLANVNALVYEQDGAWVAVLPIPAGQDDAAAEPEPEAASEENPWKVGINSMALTNVALAATFQQQDFRLSLEELMASDLLMWKPDQPAQLKLKGSFNDAPLHFDSGLTPFAEPQNFSLAISLQGLDLAPVNQFLPGTVKQVAAVLNVDTQVSLQVHADGGIGLEQNGVISLTPTRVEAMGVTANVGDIRWQGKVAVDFPKGEPAKITANGEAAVTRLDVLYPELAANAAWQDVRWQGEVRVDLPAAAQTLLALEGSLTLKELQAGQEALNLAQTLGALSWQGDIQTDLADPQNTLALKGNLSLGQWQLDDLSGRGRLAQFASLSLSDIDLQGIHQIGLSAVNLDGVFVLTEAGQEKSVASLGGLAVTEVALQDINKLNLAGVSLRDIQAEITRGEDGKLGEIDDWVADIQSRVDGFLQQLNASMGAKGAPAAQTENPEESVAAAPGDAESGGTKSADTETAAEPFEFAVNEVSLSGDNRLVFHDQGIKPHVTHPVTFKRLTVGKLDSTDINTMTPLELEAALYEYGSLTVSGEATPLQSLQGLNADIRADIKGVELPELSPYLEGATGYHAESGQLNIRSKAKISAGQLDSETKVKILRVELEPMDQAIIDKLSKKLSMPVETALSVITDSDNTLALTVPVKGDLTNPDIHLDRIILGAVGQAVTNAAFTYFKYAVQPFGAIMLVSEKIGDMTLQAKFEPALFVPGTANIVPEQQGYLEKVAGMIKEKDEFSILVCVMVTDQDFQARENPVTPPEGKSYQWDEASEALAKARLSTIKSSLINDYGLAPDRVQSCRPQIGSGKPRAVMGI